jgi:amidase
MFLSSGKTFEEAIRRGLEEAVKHLCSALQLSFEDGYRLSSAACDLKISQIVNELVTVRVAVPKQILSELFRL